MNKNPKNIFTTIIRKLRPPISPLILIGILLLLVAVFMVILFFEYDANEINVYLSTLISILGSVAATLIAVATSNKWYKHYEHFKEWGIVKAIGNREGGDVKNDEDHLNRIKKAQSSIIIIGTSLGYWFDRDEFCNKFLTLIYNKSKNHTKVKLYFLDPHSHGFSLRVKDEQWCEPEMDTNLDNVDVTNRLKKNAYERLISSMEKLKTFFENFKNSGVEVYTYDNTPLSLQKFDDDVYITYYLPYMKDRFCPELQIKDYGHFFKGSIEEKPSDDFGSFKAALYRIEKDTKKSLDISDFERIIKDAKKKNEEFIMKSNCCDFCNELDGNKQNEFNIRYNNIPCRILKLSANFSVLPSLGQLSPSHLLIVTNKHYNSIGQLDVSEREELKQIITKCSVFIDKYFIDNTENKTNKVLFFEHGVFDDKGSNGGCGISHLHLHSLCYNIDSFNILIKNLKDEHGENVKQTSDIFSETSNHYVKKQTYLLLMFNNMNYIIISKNNKFESQYLRRKISESMGQNQWDWKKTYNEGKAIKHLYEQLFAEKDNLILDN